LFGNEFSPQAYSLFHEFISYFSEAIPSSVELIAYNLSFFSSTFTLIVLSKTHAYPL